MDKEDKLEEIIEKKVQKRMEEERKKIRKEIKQELKNKQKTPEKQNKISRRSFLKKLGAGAIGLSALTLPGAALDIKDLDLEVFTGTGPDSLQKYLTVNQDGPVEITNTKL